MPTAESYDYVIVGAGSAGCVLANRLSADPNTRVLLIEAGGNDNYIWIHVPIALGFLHGNPRVDWAYKSEPEPHLNNRVIAMPRGRTLGGSSSINGMVYVRGPAADYDHWRQLGNAGWGWDDVLPYFKKSQDHMLGASETRGAGGELKVTTPPDQWEIVNAFRDAAVECGLPYDPDYNDGSGKECVSLFEMTIADGARWSAAKAFLRPALNRPNLKVVTNAIVEQLTFEGRRARGVAYGRGGVRHVAEATHEILLAAGAFGSPQILQVSGVGPAELLRSHGIEIVHELPGVGENLQDHWMVRFLHRVYNTATLNTYVDTPLRKAIMGTRYLFTRRGPMSAPPLLLTAFAKSDPAVVAPDIQLNLSIASYARIGGPIDPYPGVSTSMNVNRPTSRGYLRIKSADPTVRPAILNNYMATENDRQVGVAGMRLVRRIMDSPALARFRPEETQPTKAVATDDELIAFARETASTVFHPVSTCAMGSGPMAVVDERLRVHGIDGLRVVDASIMPTITSGNTNAPTIMIAEKGADMIREDRAKGAAAKVVTAA